MLSVVLIWFWGADVLYIRFMFHSILMSCSHANIIMQHAADTFHYILVSNNNKSKIIIDIDIDIYYYYKIVNYKYFSIFLLLSRNLLLYRAHAPV